MRRRIYWMLPDLPSARQAMKDLLLARISESHIHFVASEDADMTGLHAANLLQTSDVVRAAQAGLVIGGAVGAAAGAVVALFPIASNTPQWGIAGVLAIVGGGLGAWSASMVGCSTRNNRIRRFEQDIERGQILLMVDVPRARVEEVESLLRTSHPEAKYEGMEPAIPAFP
jgi:hypothetical protein